MSLVNKATSLGYSVQLKHDRTVTSWENHGWVKILSEGEVLAESEKIQHNRNYSGMRQAMEALAEAAINKYKELLEAKSAQDEEEAQTSEVVTTNTSTTTTDTTTTGTSEVRELVADADDAKESEKPEQA